MVEDLFASRAHEAFGVRVALRRARRDLPGLDAFAGEDSVGCPGKRAVTVCGQIRELGYPVLKIR
jgi:hypothetical protein